MTANTLERRLDGIESKLNDLERRLGRLETGHDLPLAKATPPPLPIAPSHSPLTTALPHGPHGATDAPFRADRDRPLHAPEPRANVEPTTAPMLDPRATPPDAGASTGFPPTPMSADTADGARASRSVALQTTHDPRPSTDGGAHTADAPAPTGADAAAETSASVEAADVGPASTRRASRGREALVAAYEAPVPVAVREAGALERSLGGKWAAWLGALVMVVGAGLGLKFAYDQGWLGGLPAWARLTLWAAASLAMVGAGEVVLRRIGRAASAGVFAAGLGSLFAVAYSGHAYFNLYSPATAFVLTIAATLLGAGVAARARLLSIGVLTLLGGHLAPVVIGGNAASLTPFLSYLLALQVVALLMAGLGEGRWWALRWLSLAAAGVWSLKIWGVTREVPVELLGFAVATAGLALAELMVSAVRGVLYADDRDAGTDSETPDPVAVGGVRTQPRGLAAAGVGQLELYATAAGALAAGLAYAHTPFGTPVFLVGALIAAAGLAAAARTLAALSLQRDGDAALTRLDAVLRAQALGVTALGLFHGLPAPWHLLGGAAAGLMLGVFTRLRRATPGRHFAGVAAVLMPVGAAARFAVGAWGLSDPSAGLWGIEPAVLGLGCAVTAWAALLLSSRREDNLAPPTLLSPLPALAFIPLAFAVSTPAAGVAITLAFAWAWAVVAWSGGAARYLPGAHAAGVLAVAGLLWGLFVALGPRLASGYTGAAELLLLNPTAITGLLLAASVVLMPRFVPDDADTQTGDGPSPLVLGSAAVALAIVLIAGLLEVDRAVLKLSAAGGLVWGLEPMLARAALSVAWFSACIAAWAAIARRRADVLAASTPLAVVGVAGAGLTLLASLGVRVAPVGNAVVLLAMFPLATAGLFARLLRHRPGAAAPSATLAGATLVLLAGAVEVFRYATVSAGPLAGFPPGWAAVLLLTPWAALVGVAGLWAARRWASDLPMYPALVTAGTALLLLTAAKSAALDALVPWVAGLSRYGTPLANLQLAAAASALAGLVAGWWMRTQDGRGDGARGLAPGTFRAGAIVAGLLAFAASNAEAARCLRGLGRAMGVADVRLFTLAGYSVWWAVLALGAVITGFRFRLAGLRYAGLALFGLTLLKVVLIDLAGAGQGWRVLSFIGLGAVLLATSVLYAKLAPLLLPREERAPH